MISILNFTTFVIAFEDDVLNFCIRLIACFHISDIRFYCAKADENFWRESQGSERTDLKKNNDLNIAHQSLKSSNWASWINVPGRRLSSVVCLSSVAGYLL